MLLKTFNQLDQKAARKALGTCCGARRWVQGMLHARPFHQYQAVYKTADRIWLEDCQPADWLEAFEHHPKIGDLKSLEKKFAATSKWAGQEQASVQYAEQATLKALAKGNKDYEKKFGYIFIVCATGKSAKEMLQLLQKRLKHTAEKEIKIAMKEQQKITTIRLQKLLEH